MASDLVLLLALAVAPGADPLPASVAFVKSNPATAARHATVHVASWDESEPRPTLADGSSSFNASGGTGSSSRRNRTPRSTASLRLASTHAAESRATNGGPVEHGNAVAHESDVVYEGGSHDCACDECIPVGHHHHSVWGIWGLPDPCHAPGGWTQHIPYVAHPKNYYYFRPYNYFHIADHQNEVANYGGNPKHPYSNRVFQRAYDRVIEPTGDHEEIQPITPLRPLRRR